MISYWIRTMGLLTIFELPWLGLLISPLYLSLFLKRTSFKEREMFQYGLLAIGLFLGILKELYL